MEAFYYSTTLCSYATLLLSVITGCIFFRRIPKNTVLLLYYLAVVLLLETTAELLAYAGMDNLFLFPYYLAAELFIFGCFFIRLFDFPRMSLIVPFALSAALLFMGTKTAENTLIKPVIHLLIISGSGYYLFRVLTNFSYDRRFLRVNYMLILYFSASLLLFFFLDQLPAIRLTEAYLLWGSHNLLLSLFYAILLFYFLSHRTENK